MHFFIELIGPNNTMKVIHFVTAIDRSLGGVSMYIQLLAKELGKHVDLIIVTCPTLNPLPIENARIIYLPLPLKEINQFTSQWKEILNEEKPDVVHINGIWMIQTWIIQREALKRNIKTYITPHGMLEPWILNRHPWKKKLALTLFQKKALKQAVALVATAESERENVVSLNYNGNVTVIPNGIDIESIAIKTDWSIKKRILFLSRVHPKKGIELLLETVYSLKEELKEYEVIIAGEGEENYIRALKQINKEKGCSGIIKFIGGVYGEEKWKLFREADCFVLPTHSENFGYVIAEALASGTPVITTKGTPWNELEAKGCGWWTDIGTQATVKALKEFLQLSESTLETMGRNGRTLIEEKYSAKKMADGMIELYATIK